MRVQYLKQYLSACRQGDHDGYLVIIKLVPAMSLVVDNQKWKQLMAGKTEVRRQYTHVRMYIHTYIRTYHVRYMAVPTTCWCMR